MLLSKLLSNSKKRHNDLIKTDKNSMKCVINRTDNQTFIPVITKSLRKSRFLIHAGCSYSFFHDGVILKTTLENDLYLRL